jgi:hypothetical protein
MSAIGSFATMLGIFGGFAGLALIVSKFLGGDIKIRELVTDLFKKKSDSQIKAVDTERKDIAEKVIASEKIAETKKEKIKDIKKKAAKETILQSLM